MSALIDADVHCLVPSIQALFPYLDAHWREYATQSHFRGPMDTYYPPAPTTLRAGARPPTELALLQPGLDATGADLAILNCAYAIEGIWNPDLEVAMARAVNEWLVEHWLARDPRLRASLMVPVKQPAEAAREVERARKSHAGFVQVFLPIRSPEPYGKRAYWPLWEAIQAHDLVAGLHFGGASGNPPTSVGWSSLYVEEYAGMAQVYQSQLMSMIVEGVFDRFPRLRVSCLESGFAWLRPFLWRLDKDWKGLRREVPWNTRVPSEYVREHVRFTLQPVDGPPDPARVIADLEEQLMFSTDYPHWHGDDAPPELGRKILSENAQGWYRL
jgi:predicted TIM-barrel fold metal-dependent hydrolase